MTKPWCDLREGFNRLVARKGARNVADAIPADPVTVYRLLKGETKQPTRAVRASVERMLAQEQEKEDDQQ